MSKPLLQFQKLFETNCSKKEAYQIISSLEPNYLCSSELLEIIEWVEKSAKLPIIFPNHINIFGTGGDSSNDILGKTLNISSLAAIIASQKTTVVKVGTRGVTAKWGSAEFFQYHANLPKNKKYPFIFKSPSRFISLTELGFRYSNNIILARRRIFYENRLDIFKVVFPFANLTHSYGQVNGIARTEYMKIYSLLSAERPKSKILLVNNEYGHDELLPGENNLIFHFNGETKKINLILENSSKEIEGLFKQRDTIMEQVVTPKELLNNNLTREPFLDILCINAACIVAINYWSDFSSNLLTEKSKQLKNIILNKLDFAENQNSVYL